MSKLLRQQKPMRNMLWALVPCIAGSVYYFGLRSLAMIACCCIVGFITEYIFCKQRGEPVTQACFVTSTLFALVMPPAVGWHILIIGTVFSVMFAKEVFGGFGRNIFNPALAGRCFVYICFPLAMTGQWSPPSTDSIGAITKWQSWPDAITSATPMAHLKSGRLVISNNSDENWQEKLASDPRATATVTPSRIISALAIGNISGTMGVTSAILIAIGGIYLFWTKTASRSIILSTIISYFVFNQALYFMGIDNAYGGIYPVLGGGFLFGAFFMATDPVSSPRKLPARIIYGIIIALCTTVIRNFSIFNGGLMFSILIGNMFAPILDYAVDSIQKRKSKVS